MKKIYSIVILAMMAVAGFAADIDYWTKATVAPVLKGGTETTAAGLVFAAESPVADASDIAAQATPYTTDPYKLTGASGTSAVNKEWYFYASVKVGYKFLGFASSKTGTPSGGGAVDKLEKVGDFYVYAAKSGAGFSANTEATAKEVKRYAVYEKDENYKPTAIDVEGLARYESYSVDPESGSTLQSLRCITVAFDPDDEPIGIMPAAADVTLFSVAGGEKTALSNKVTAAVTDGKLVLTIEPAVADTMTLEVNIPTAMTNNVAGPIATMTKEQLAAMGYTTNPAITLSYTIIPGLVAIDRITNQTDSVLLPDAKLVLVTGEEGNGQEVTAFFVKYVNKLVSCVKPAEFKNYVTVTNVSNGTRLNLNDYSCELGIMKTNVELNRNYRDSMYLNIRLSSENYINTERCQGEYHVVILPGLGLDENGLRTEGAEFSFTYGDPANVEQVEEVDLSEYAGAYKLYLSAGEKLSDGQLREYFNLVEKGGKYYLTDLLGSKLEIEVYEQYKKYYLRATKDGALGFDNGRGEDVAISFSKQNGTCNIYVDYYKLTDPAMAGGIYAGGLCNFQRTGAVVTGIKESATLEKAAKTLRDGKLVIVHDGAMYDVTGTRL